MYVYMFVDEKKVESYFSDRLTFSNIRSRTSRQIYRLALLLCTPEMLYSLSKSSISIFIAHLTLFLHRMTLYNSIGKYCHLTWNEAPPLFSELELRLGSKEHYHCIAVGRPDNTQNCCRTGEECEELCLRRGVNCYLKDVKRNRGNSLAI